MKMMWSRKYTRIWDEILRTFFVIITNILFNPFRFLRYDLIGFEFNWFVEVLNEYLKVGNVSDVLFEMQILNIIYVYQNSYSLIKFIQKQRALVMPIKTQEIRPTQKSGLELLYVCSLAPLKITQLHICFLANIGPKSMYNIEKWCELIVET